ncbi:Ig-like domain-containing protein [Candidatus Palauibacter sp.]|uniref:Ig-like domain-containing protein n=1 Tax=Candidatus Palauibacter sp. TaxID=3101350 RepID=UPI003AF3122E
MPDVELPVGEAAVIDAARHFSDPDGDSLAIAAESSDTSVASAGVAGDSVSVRAIAPGMATITVTATDPGGLAATQAFAITVPNRPPHATDPLPHIELRVGDEAAADLSTHFADPDGQPLAFTAESSDGAVAAVAVSGQEMTLIAIASGMATITVTATDPGGLTAMQTFSVTVLNPRPPNRAPETIGTIPDIGLRVGGEAVVDASRYFSDPDGDPLAIAAESSDGSRAVPVTSGHEVRVRALAQGTVTITVTASDPGGLSATQTFTVAVSGRGGGDGFSISLHFTDAVPAAYRPTLESAAGHLMAILSGTEWDDVAINGTRQCFGEVALGTVDDVAIRVDAVDLDGDLGVVARAGACIERTDSAPVLGSIRLDQADLAVLEQYNDLFEVMVHEIIHVLGFGPRWVSLGLLDQDSDPVFDPHFTGPRAIAAFNAAGGADYTGEKVPIEPGQGHWRASVFGMELMSSFLYVNRREPLSAITLEALVDMGYAVNLSYAEPFQLPSADRMAAEAGRGTAVEARDEVDRRPVVVVDRDGRTVRVIPPW